MESNDNTANSAHGPASVLDTKISSKKEIPEWPIAPTFLSLRQGYKEDDPNTNYNADGVYYSDYIRGFLADLSHEENIKNALSIFQFVPKDFLLDNQFADNQQIIMQDPGKAVVILNEPLIPKIGEILDRQNKTIIRIDSGTYVNNGRLCNAFRKCGNTELCFMQDSIVGIFADEKLNKSKPSSDNYHKRLEELINEFNLINEVKLAYVDGGDEKKRLYLHYTCPYSSFEEHIFPIYAQDRTIACLMFGQMAREAFSKKNSFSKYFKTMQKIDPECHNYISEISNLELNKWDKKAQVIVNRIEIFEKRLEDRIRHRNTRYINYAFTIIEQQFRENVKAINVKRNDAIEEFSNALNKAFNAIRVKFDHSCDGFIRMFALPIDIKHDKLVPIAWSDTTLDFNDDFMFELKQLKDIDNLPSYQQKERIKESASQKIKDSFDEERGDVFLPGCLAGAEVAYIVWKRHDQSLNRQSNSFKEYKRALQNFYSVALESYSYIRGTKMELLLETTIQESAHESAHFILPAIDIIEDELIKKTTKIKEVMEDFRTQRFESFWDPLKKVLESLNQLKEINYGPSLIFSSNLKINKKVVLVFDLLNKLKTMLNSRAKDSYKSIFYEQKANYLEANIDANYFNHALYNLLDNAIKYGFDGSKIHLKLDTDKNGEKMIVKIISYGIGIKEREKIYQLFERGEEASKISRGTGLGMYIVQKVCNAHGGTVSHISELLSEYNIPVLFNYKYNSSLAKNCSENVKSKYDKERERLAGAEKEIVYDTHFVEYANVFSNRINMHTYRNTFIVTIPLH